MAKSHCTYICIKSSKELCVLCVKKHRKIAQVSTCYDDLRYEKMKTEIALNLFKEVATRWIEDLSRSVEH